METDFPQKPAGQRPVQSLLFVCGLNTVRSPMAETLARHIFQGEVYVRSAGVRKGEPDAFTRVVLTEAGLDPGDQTSQTLDDLDIREGLNFDLIVALSPEAHRVALELTRTLAGEVEYWPIADPALEQGSRERKLDAYRAVRDSLSARITARFGFKPGG